MGGYMPSAYQSRWPEVSNSFALGDVRGVDELVALLLVAPARVVLHRRRMTPPLGWKTARPEPISSGKENRSSSVPSLRWSRFSASASRSRCAFELVLGLPGGAVDALQLRVLLAAAPVRGGGAHQLERRDAAGGRQVRTAAQVLPAPARRLRRGCRRSSARRRRPRRRAVGRSSAREPPLRPISSSLYGSSASSSRASSSVTTRREKRWPCLTISLHPLLDAP